MVSEPAPDSSEQPAAQPNARWKSRLGALFPFIITALASIGISLLAQAFIVFPTARVAPTAATVSPAAASSPTPTSEAAALTPTPTPTPLAPDERVLAQQILDLEAEVRVLWSSIYLIRAASQLSDAELALQINDLDEVERLLSTTRASLDRAYDYADVYKNPVDDLRSRVSKIRANLRVRPEGIDQQMRRLRQDVLSLVSTLE